MNFVDKGKGKAVEEVVEDSSDGSGTAAGPTMESSTSALFQSKNGFDSTYANAFTGPLQHSAPQSSHHTVHRPAMIIQSPQRQSHSLPVTRSNSPLFDCSPSRVSVTSERNAMPGRAGGPSKSRISDVERSAGTGGPIAPLPDRKNGRSPVRKEIAATPLLHHSPPLSLSISSPSPTRSDSPTAHHLLAHLDSLTSTSAFSSIPPSMSRSFTTAQSIGRPSSAPGVQRNRSNSSSGMVSRRLDRFSDPATHWLSEDEGGNMVRAAITQPEMAERSARRQACRPGGDDEPKRDRNGDPSSKLLSNMISTPKHHLIHHRPSSAFSQSPSISPTPSSHHSNSPTPNLADILSDISNTISCPSCHKTLRDPTTLGCGHSVCLSCTLPTQTNFIRPLIDFSEESQFTRNPILPVITPIARGSLTSTAGIGNFNNDRRSISTSGVVRNKVTCPVKDCEHKERGIATGVEAKVDYVLQKVLSLLRRDVPDFEIEVNLMDYDMEMDADDEGEVELELDHEGDSPISNGSGGGVEEVEDSKRIHRSRDWKTTKRSRTGNAKPIFEKVTTFDMDRVPATFLNELQSELECQVCVQLYHDPITTPCGHTFCAKCLARSLDHSDKCALCRSDIPSFTFFQSQPINTTTNSIISIAFPTLQAERKASIEAEEKSSSMDTPIFVCTLAWPNLPTYMHIFEPRYRLMMRRVMDGDRMFGMVLPSRNDGGVSEYGTMLQVQSCNMIEDGRSIVECIGSYRFRVLEKGTFDGYTVGRIERVDDISPEQEAELERIALARNVGPITPPRAPISLSSSSSSTPSGSPPAELPVELSTAQLMAVCLEFVQTLRSGSAPWVLQRLNNTIGPMPTNASDFSFWMAEVMPVDDHVKAALLQITSPRERLRLLVFWIEQFRSSWWFSRGCCVM